MAATSLTVNASTALAYSIFLNQERASTHCAFESTASLACLTGHVKRKKRNSTHLVSLPGVKTFAAEGSNQGTSHQTAFDSLSTLYLPLMNRFTRTLDRSYRPTVNLQKLPRLTGWLRNMPNSGRTSRRLLIPSRDAPP